MYILILTLSMASGMSVAYAVADKTTNDQVTYNLTQEHIKSVYGEAINRWVESGIDRKRFDNVKISITNLKGSTIGYGGYNHITLDHNGAGAGWYIDLTPDEDEEYYINTNQTFTYDADAGTVTATYGNATARAHADANATDDDTIIKINSVTIDSILFIKL